MTRFKIENYRGLRVAEAVGLENEPLVLLTGKNGTGKSLVLEALTAAWSGNINLPEFVGPYGYSLSIELGVRLDSVEYDAIDAWRTERDLSTVPRLDEHVLSAISTSREASGAYSNTDDVLETLRNPLFARQYPFASIDLLSARRQVSMTTSSTVDLSILDKAASADQRRLMYEQEIRWKSAMQMPDIGTYLTSLDYRDYIASRQGEDLDSEYQRLSDLFHGATGKRVAIPAYDPRTARTTISVNLPSGIAHSLEDLSNGEREMLGMLYYVSQLSAQGGVLLLDEPEKHLHPALQLAVLRAMMSVAERAQLLVVTHSPGLIASAPSNSVLVVEPAWSSVLNQIARVSDSDQHDDVLFDLGLARRDLLQNSMLLIVEGVDDQKRLEMLFPEELASARVVVAGGRHRALEMATALRGFDLGLPWMCVVDRDFLKDEEVKELAGPPEIFVWSARMLENILLEPVLVAASVSALDLTIGEIESRIAAAALEHRESAIQQFVHERISALVPDVPFEVDPDLDKIERELLQEKQLWELRIEQYKRVSAEVRAEIEMAWDVDWRKYVDGKRVLAGVHNKMRVFADKAMLVDDMMVRARADESLMPPEALRLRDQLRRSIAVSQQSVPFDEGSTSARDAAVIAKVADIGPATALNASAPSWEPGC